MFDAVYYINLDHRTDRKEHIEKELKRMGFESVKRFPAVKQEPGYLGCLLSHLNLLKHARDKKYKNILIFEDDFEFIISKEKFWEIIEKVKNKDYDVIMLGANRPSSKTLPHNNNFVKVDSALTTSAYVVNSKFYDTLISKLEGCVPKLIENPDAQGLYSIDVCWMDLQPKSKWYLFNEKIGKQMGSHSNIQKGFVNYQTGGIKQTAGFGQTGGIKQTAGFGQTGGIKMKNKKKRKTKKTRRSSLPRQS